jgi:hypothetical protein
MQLINAITEKMAYQKSSHRAGWLAVLLLVTQWPQTEAAVFVSIGQNFTGNTFGDISQALPPDSNGAVGPSHFMEFINGAVSVYNKTDGQSVLGLADVDFWSQAGVTVSSTSGISDPRVIYDPASQRWFASQVDFNGIATDPTLQANNFLLAVSDTSDPTGTWHGFRFRADPTTGKFADFPTLGVDSNAVYIAGDFYHGETNAVGSGLVSIPKADLLSAMPTVANRHWFGVMDYATRGDVLQPAICFDGSANGSVLSIADIGSDTDPHSNVVWFAVQNAGGTSPTVTASTFLNVLPYEVPYNADLDAPQFTVHQPDNTTTLLANDARLSAKVYAVNGILYAVHNTLLNGRLAIRWYRIRATDHTLIEQGTIADTNLDLFFPSIAVNQFGVVVIGCNGSGSATYVSSYAYVGEIKNGTTTFGDKILLKAGVDNYHDVFEILAQLEDEPVVPSRWGDYSAMSVDPADPTRFWTIQMYPSAVDPDSGAGYWSTQITEIIADTRPPLGIAGAGTNVLVSWPLAASDFQLQSNTNLLATNGWTVITSGISTNGANITVLVPKNTSAQFFRLKL